MDVQRGQALQHRAPVVLALAQRRNPEAEARPARTSAPGWSGWGSARPRRTRWRPPRAASRCPRRTAPPRGRGAASTRRLQLPGTASCPVTFETTPRRGAAKVTDAATASKAASIGSISGEWNAWETLRGLVRTPSAVELAQHGLEGLGVAGEDHAVGAVHGGERQPGAVARDDLATRSSGAKTATIAPPAGRACMSRPRVRDQAEAVLQGEDPGHAGRHVLADAVAQRRATARRPRTARARPARTPARRAPAACTRSRRARRPPRLRVHHREQRLAAQGAERLVAPVERLPEDGLGLVEPPPHPGVLGALAGEEEGDLGAGLPLDVPPHETRRLRRRAASALPARAAASAAASATSASAMREVRPADVRGEGDVAEVQARGPPRGARRARRRASGERLASAPRGSAGGAGARRRGRAEAATAGASSTTRWALVPLNPKELTPADARRAPRRPGRALGDDPHRKLLPGNVRIRLPEVQVRRDLAVLERRAPP